MRALIVGADNRVKTESYAATPEFLERIRNRERAALDTLVRHETPRIEGLLTRILGPREDLADLVQNVFVELLRSVDRFRGDSALSTFIGGITVQVARRAMRGSAYDRRRAPMPSVVRSVDADPSQSTFESERSRHLRAALERIKPKKRIAFCLWAIEGMEIPEIAELTKSTESAVRGRIWHARKELRRHASRDPHLKQLLEGIDHD